MAFAALVSSCSPVIAALPQHDNPPIYARLVSEWIGSVGLDPTLFGTHSLRCLP